MTRAARLLAGFGRRLGLLRSNTNGNIALSFAFFGPAIMLLGVGAIDLFAVHTAQVKLQGIADAGALAGAPALALATDGAGAKERAASFVEAAMSEWKDRPVVEGRYQIVDQGGQRAIHVLLNANRSSFFANMLPPGGWNFQGDATATSLGLIPLCVLVTGGDKTRVLHVRDAGRLSAPACMVHSNRDIVVEGGSIAAAAVQAVTSASGTISPSPGMGAARVDDPFSALELDRSKLQACLHRTAIPPLRLNAGVNRIAAGVHCGGMEVSGTGTVILGPGEHWFLGGQLIVRDSARLQGDDVVLFFDKFSRFDFRDHSLVRLSGRTTGNFAGIVMSATRDNTQDFNISSDNVESLLGVIYVPNARLVVEGRADVARDSAWTVIVAQRLQLKGSPSLFINANYQTTTVPVPNGVGPRTAGARLIQ